MRREWGTLPSFPTLSPSLSPSISVGKAFTTLFLAFIQLPLLPPPPPLPFFPLPTAFNASKQYEGARNKTFRIAGKS